MNFGEVLERSWKVIWKFKILWLFGLLASCGVSRGNSRWNFNDSGSGSSANSFRLGTGQNFNNLPQQWQPYIQQAQELSRNFQAWEALLVLICCLTLLLVIVFFMIGVLGRTGLARGAWLADDGQPRLNWSILWKESKRYYWRVFWYTLLLTGISVAVALILMLPVMAVGIVTMGIGLICLGIPLICVFVIFGWFMSILTEQGTVAIVGEDLGVMAGLQRGWDVIRTSWGPMILMSLILYIGSFIIALILAVPLLIIILPIIAGLASGTLTGTSIGLVIGGLFLIVYIPITMFITSVLTAYVSTAWVLTFRRLTGREADSGKAGLLPISPGDVDLTPAAL